MEPRARGFRVVLEVEADQPVLEFTGRLTKALVFALSPELQALRGIEGAVSPIHVSPLFKVSGDHDLGDPAYPYAVRSKEAGEIAPVSLGGEYVFHVGGDADVASRIASRLGQLQGPLLMRIHDVTVKFKVEKVVDVTKEVLEKAGSVGGRVRVYLKSPAQVFNVFTATKLPKFSPSAVELLMVPYAVLQGSYTITEQLVVSSFRVLGKLVETWYSIRTLRPVEVVFKGKRQVNMAGSVTYIVQEWPPGAGAAEGEGGLDAIRATLALAELVGIGRSRQNGFGTVVIK